jgi:hypothetical protein
MRNPEGLSAMSRKAEKKRAIAAKLESLPARQATPPALISGGANIHVLEDFNEGSAGTAKRYRALPGEHPLVKAWIRRKISPEQFNAGNKYRVLYEKANAPHGVDSTQLMAISRSFGPKIGGGLAGDGQAHTSLKIIESRLSPVNCAIVRNFCGIGIAMGCSVQSVIDFHPTGYLSRLKEALDDLASVIQKISVPDLERDIEQEIA